MKRPIQTAFLVPDREIAVTLPTIESLLGDKLTGNFGREDEVVVRAVDDFASTALRNARRFVAMERLGLRDQETGAYNLAYFVDYAGKEAYKARRYGRSFSLITLTVAIIGALLMLLVESPGAHHRFCLPDRPVSLGHLI